MTLVAGVGPSVLVEIYSDVVCPWCYIGKRRFEAALEKFEGADDVTVVWRPFQLDPTAPATPTPVVDAYARKFGGPEQAARIIEHVTETAAGDGLEFHLFEAQRANTFDAHRLLRRAGELGPDVQNVLKERLLRAYFVESRDVSDHGTLIEFAVEAGMDGDEVAALLASDADVAELRAELDAAVERDITAVPTFVFEGKWSVPGAQEPETMLLVLQRVADRLSQSA